METRRERIKALVRTHLPGQPLGGKGITLKYLEGLLIEKEVLSEAPKGDGVALTFPQTKKEEKSYLKGLFPFDQDDLNLSVFLHLDKETVIYFSQTNRHFRKLLDKNSHFWYWRLEKDLKISLPPLSHYETGLTLRGQYFHIIQAPKDRLWSLDLGPRTIEFFEPLIDSYSDTLRTIILQSRGVGNREFLDFLIRKSEETSEFEESEVTEALSYSIRKKNFQVAKYLLERTKMTYKLSYILYFNLLELPTIDLEDYVTNYWSLPQKSSIYLEILSRSLGVPMENGSRTKEAVLWTLGKIGQEEWSASIGAI